MTPSDLAVEEIRSSVTGRRVLVCVGGGIAAYKSCEVVRILHRAGAIVEVAMTRAATEFVTPLTFQALSQRPVGTSLLDAGEEQQIGHIAIADRAELVVVTPCTADLAAKLRAGLADDLVTTALLATRAPILVAPGMNVHMWNHPATRENFDVLRARGVHTIGPGSGAMACGHVGDGRLAEPWDIARAAATILSKKDFQKKSILVTAGPTREHLDPVRFLSNPSSGRMGFAIAAAAARRGARVTLVTGPTELALPFGVDTMLAVVSAAQLAEAVKQGESTHDVIIMAAAVSDQRPEITHASKVKKSAGPEILTFVRTEDVLAGLGDRRLGGMTGPLLVGFAAETENVIENARRKLLQKHIDLIVANRVGDGGAFGRSDNEVTIVSSGGEWDVPRASKDAVADRILDVVRERLDAA